jgi:DNA replication protein DnaC
MLEINQSLKTVLKRLKLSGLLPTLPDRVAYARKTKLSELDFLEIVLQDEGERRDQKNLALRLARAGFEQEQTLESFNWNAPVTFDRDRVRDLFSLGFIERQEDVIFLGPVGVGKTFLACALGHAACRAAREVLFMRADRLLQQLHQSRADHSTDKVFRRLLAPDLLIIDDFALRRLDHQQSSDFYEVILERHRRASTILTSNRSIDEWIPLFDDPVLAQSAIDRLAHNAYQVVMEGESYRKLQRPGDSAAEPHRPPHNSRPKKRRLR